ncbi:unnamed protein product, partial [Brassica oleracea var. botrytis]
RSFNSANGSRVFVTLCDLKAKDETILAPAAEYRKYHSSLARENFGDFPGSRKTRVINFVVLPALGGKRPSAIGESSPAIIRPQTTPAVIKKSKLSQTTVRRRTRSYGEELPERPPAKQQRYPDSGSEDGPVGGDSSGGQFSDGLSVHFTVIPDEERLLLVDQNEDRQVTSLRFEGMENNIEELRTLICKSLGLPEGSKRNARKRKAMDDPQEVSRKNPPSSERESGHQNDDDHAKENESDNAGFPPSGGNKGDQQQETQSNGLVLFGDVLDVERESYVLPAEVPCGNLHGGMAEKNPTYRYEQGSPVAWEKTKPNCYSSVGSVRSFHRSWDGNPSSKSKVASTGIETCPLLIIS